MVGYLLPNYRPLTHSHRHARIALGQNHGRHHHGAPMRQRQAQAALKSAYPRPLHRRPAEEDPDDRRIRELAIAINREAGSVGTGRAIAEFYALSLTGAVIVLSLPTVGLFLNEQLLGSLEGRLFWSGFRDGALDAAKYFSRTVSGRVISTAGIGVYLDELGEGPVQNYLWGILSRLWAYGSQGPVEAFISETPGQVWQTIEAPILWSADGFTRLLQSATVITTHPW